MTKEEKIREAWIAEIGEIRFEEIKQKITWHDGSIDQKDIPEIEIKDLWKEDCKFDSESHEWFNNGGDNYQMQTEFTIRPKSLSGIEDNNGWTKVEGENDLPKQAGKYWIIFAGGQTMNQEKFDPTDNWLTIIWKTRVSWYHPVIIPNPPLY